MATEYRTVCRHFGEKDHSGHKWGKKSLEKAEQSKRDANHHAETQPDSYYSGEAPYEIQTREVTEWEAL